MERLIGMYTNANICGVLLWMPELMQDSVRASSCLILGLPYYVHSLFMAYVMLVVWYVMMRHRLPSIYSPKVSFGRGIAVAGVVG